MSGTARIRLHQALHGYADGHRELASSVQLKARDTKTMLVLSDVSGPGVRIDEAGYLTGYPLADAGLYAIARTWGAPEMPRPGCVWTHTLLIDFADLAKLGALTDLMAHFSHPQVNGAAAYGKPLSCARDAEPSRLQSLDLSRLRHLMGALYGRPKAPIIAAQAPEVRDERLVTSLWLQQWPRLRRNFRFCTLAATDRSTRGALFDLQLLPAGQHALRTRFPNAVDAESVAVAGAWLEDALADLRHPGTDGLRGFLRRIGGDVGEGRAAFAPLCRLHRLIDRIGAEPAALNEAITVMQDDLRTTEARAAQAIVADAALTQVDKLDDSGLDYLLDRIALVDVSRLSAEAPRLGQTLLRRRPAQFASMLGQDGPLGSLIDRIIAATAPADLIAVLATMPALAAPILLGRPELAADPALWARPLGIDEHALRALRSTTIDRDEILGAILAANRGDLAHSVVAEAGALDVLKALAQAIRADLQPAGIDQWLNAAAHADAVAELLTRTEPLPRPMLTRLTQTLGPDDTPNDYGEDPWLTAVRGAEGQASDAEETRLRAFLLARSLGRRSRNQAELAQLGFEATHHAAAERRLPDDAWRWLEPRLPWSIMWFEWDKCQRLREGLAKLFVERNLAPETFSSVVASDALFIALIWQVGRMSSGRRYLKRVADTLKSMRSPTAELRRQLIKETID